MLTDRERINQDVLSFIQYQGVALFPRHISTILGISKRETKEALWALVERGELEFTRDYLIKVKD